MKTCNQEGRRWSGLVLCLASLFLASCADMPFGTSSEETPRASAEPLAAKSALGFYQRAASASAEQRDEEYHYLTEVEPHDNAVIQRTKLALLLTVSLQADRADEMRALELLEQLEEVGASLSQPASDYLQLGMLWRDRLQQRQELRELRAETEELRQRLQQMATENRRLNQQIEALTTIEQQLNQREQNQDQDQQEEQDQDSEESAGEPDS